ncbi:protein of unknown function [Cupriavidus taiwanensis]|uniref:Uncharacterized protein n=1 Tax=Cupriavidus taiwanensis TaxID=164546 RepID=A0A375IKQ2_9BURK|nr:protein of unknown function [Cupriavidus taiwanensis]
MLEYKLLTLKPKLAIPKVTLSPIYWVNLLRARGQLSLLRTRYCKFGGRRNTDEALRNG